MRAVLRYRHIPFKWVPQGSKWDDLPPFPLIPAIAFPDATGAYTDTMIDSSPLIARLEGMYSERSLVPTDSVVAFIDYLLEDYADEWVTKQMYHYRWYYNDAIDKAGKLLPLDGDQQMPVEMLSRFTNYITERQIGRRALVGSTEENKPAIEESFHRLLDMMQAHLAVAPFLLGDRPGRGDFALFGQMTELLRWDPESVRIGIERAHLEEDTGKSTHIGGTSGRIHGSDYSLVDFNRAGVPLVEIVSRPDIRNSDQARQYVAELRSILLAVGASDAKMEEGSMRCDVNVSVRKPGAEFGTRCEIKNVNSIRAVGKAIDYEARRQIDVLESGGTIRQETRHWDDSEGRTHTLRTKEDADDYR
jgi:glutathione S-transferase